MKELKCVITITGEAGSFDGLVNLEYFPSEEAPEWENSCPGKG